MPINDFIQFHFGWLNAWIPSFALVLIQLLYMILYREGGKRAVDTSWYTSKDKRYATLSFVFQGTLLLVSLFVPLRIGTPLFTVGCVLFAFALVGFMAAFHAYASTPKGETVVRGVYRPACRAIRCTSSMKWEHWRFALPRHRCGCCLPQFL